MISNQERERIENSLSGYAEELGFIDTYSLVSTYPEHAKNYLVRVTFEGDENRATNAIIEMALGVEVDAK